MVRKSPRLLGEKSRLRRLFLPAALRAYERERAERALPLTLRSYAFGALLQLPQPLVCRARNLVIGRLPVERHFLDHTTYDCGTLP